MELVIYIIIAVFFVCKLYASFGHTNDMEDKGGERYVDAFVEEINKSQDPNYKGSGYCDDLDQNAGYSVPIPFNLPPESRENLRKIAKLDPSFTIESFFKGAELAFELMFKAYTTFDMSIINDFVSEDICDRLRSRVEKMKSEGMVNKSVVVSSGPISLEEVQLKGTIARIKVKFNTEQVILIENANKDKVYGDASSRVNVTDVWLLERDMSLTDPNWKLVALD